MNNPCRTPSDTLSKPNEPEALADLPAFRPSPTKSLDFPEDPRPHRVSEPEALLPDDFDIIVGGILPNNPNLFIDLLAWGRNSDVDECCFCF